jgi:hypothetical protein
MIISQISVDGEEFHASLEDLAKIPSSLQSSLLLSFFSCSFHLLTSLSSFFSFLSFALGSLPFLLFVWKGAKEDDVCVCVCV